MGTETDRDLMPLGYQALEGDRVALRRIVECSHEDFHSEIHPPLFFVRAQAIAANSNPDIPVGGLVAQTYSRVNGRSYLVGQEFGGGALRSHLTTEALKVVTLRSNRIEAHPLMSAKPFSFSGVHVFGCVVRAPVKPPQVTALQIPVLMCTFHFTVQTRVAVQVARESSDSVRVYVSMNAVNYKPAPLPVRRDLNISFDSLKRDAPDVATDINLFLAAAYAAQGPFAMKRLGSTTFALLNLPSQLIEMSSSEICLSDPGPVPLPWSCRSARR